MKRAGVVVKGSRSVHGGGEATGSAVVKYGECEKNQAAAVGGHAVDGCREFIATSSDHRTAAALVCAACGCHRSLHKRLVFKDNIFTQS